jgi:Family of unknown function (DUF5681)
MPKTNNNNQRAQDEPHESSNATTDQESTTPQYAVGYCRPPIEKRFQKGKSGNPTGRPKGWRNIKSELEEVAHRKVRIRDGDKEREMSLLGANFFAQAVKGAKGDTQSSGLVFKLADRVGLMDSEAEPCADNVRPCEHTGRVAHGHSSAAPSGALFENLDIDRLSREEINELSRLAEVIDLGGDFTALSLNDFERAKHIVNKGRGKDVTPV